MAIVTYIPVQDMMKWTCKELGIGKSICLDDSKLSPMLNTFDHVGATMLECLKANQGHKYKLARHHRIM